MSKKPADHGKGWTDTDLQKLERLIDQNSPTRVMGLKLGRIPDSNRLKASEEGLSLRPVNQSPYNRRKK